MTELQSARWDVDYTKPFAKQMVSSDATGYPLVSQGGFGADLIRFEPGEKVGPHTHPGDHILICIAGTGILWFDGAQYVINVGFIYFVPGEVPHAVYAHPNSEGPLVLFAVGNNHWPVDSPARLNVIKREVVPVW